MLRYHLIRVNTQKTFYGVNYENMFPQLVNIPDQRGISSNWQAFALALES